MFSLATAYLMAGNLSAYGYLGLPQSAAHLLEAFGDDALRAAYMAPLYRGEWTGTMALTEPHAGALGARGLRLGTLGALVRPSDA